MEIVYHSARLNKWFRTGTDIQYTANSEDSKQYYTLSFTHTFEFTDDIVSFSYSYPYTYTELRANIYFNWKGKFITRQTLCKTLAGYNCDYLTIMSDVDNHKKHGIVLTARVHPGETVGSWILHGIIDFLLSKNPIASILRKKFIFKIIPMLNPDGVMQGNYRSCLAGCDLNRKYIGTGKVINDHT